MIASPLKHIETTDYDRIIRPRRGLQGFNLTELWQYRELFFFLAWRDILVRYKQTYLGITWAVLQPFLTTVVFTVIFGVLAKFPTEGLPYAVVSLAALLPWQFFSNAMTESSNSLVASSRMISKIYFPRLIIPASAVVSGAIDFGIGFIMLVGLMIYHGLPFTPHMLLLPVFLLIAVMAALSVGLWFSALSVKYRDVKYVVPFLARIGLYASSVVYTTQWVAEKVSEKWLLLYCLNPMVGVIDGFRWCLFGAQFEPYWPGFAGSLIMLFLLLISGALYFRKTERTFADFI